MLTVKQAYTGALLEKIALDSGEEIEKKLSIAHALHLNNRQGLPAYERIAVLEKLAVLLLDESNNLAQLIANEGGKPLLDAQVEVSRAIDGVKLAVSEIRTMRGVQIPMDLTPAGADRIAFTIPEPIGIVVAVSAFNHPLNLIVHQVVPAIATGCPVIVKPAEQTPLSCLNFVRLVEKAGLTPGWLQVCVCGVSDAEKLVTDNRINFFSFIGSAHVGWYLRSKLSAGVRCSLEHGGAAPLIFHSHRDIDGFINGLSKAAFYHAGQVCVSTQRVFVPKSMTRTIAQKLAEKAKTLKVGDAILPDTEVGPLILPREVERVAAWVDGAISEGAELLSGGERLGETSFAPTVLLNPSLNSKVSTHEIFGPVVCIYAYDDVDVAIKIANSLDVAFQAAIFSDDIHFAMNNAKKLDASAVMINDYSVFRTDWMPFAGRRHSGYSTGGIGYTMRDMCEGKMLVIKS